MSLEHNSQVPSTCFPPQVTHSPSSVYTMDTARQGASVLASEGTIAMGRSSWCATILAMSSSLPPAWSPHVQAGQQEGEALCLGGAQWVVREHGDQP